jgi:predicted metal-dependent peptidase
MAKATKTQGTAGGTPNVASTKKVVDPIRLRDFDMDSHLVALNWADSFYADVIRSLTKIETDDIPTAGVVQKGSEITMWWNREFCAGLSDKQVRGLLKHESLHLILLHTTTRRYEPHWVHNWAADLAINSMIPEEELPEGGLIPGRPFPKLTAEQIAERTEEEVERHEKLSKLIASFPKGESTEWYFGKLMENDTIKEMEQERKDAEEAFKEMMGKLMEGMGKDSHEGWGDSDNVSEEDRQLAEGKIRQVLKEASQKADRQNSWGTVPAEMQAHIRKLVSGEIPWQSVLRQFVGFTHRQDRMETWTRSSKKDPMGAPGTTYNYLPSINIYVDQSGSVPDSSLELFFGELAALSRKATFKVYYFDTEVDVKNGFEWRRGAAVSPKRTRCGGTDFDAPTAHANGDRSCDAYMILTDGGAPKPADGRKRRGWILDPGNKLYFNDVPSRDVVIQMKHAEKKAEAA